MVMCKGHSPHAANVAMSARTSLPVASLAFCDPDYPPSTPGPSQRQVLLTLHRTARATSCPLQLPSEDSPTQRSWVWMGCAEAVPPIPRWVTASLLPSRCTRLLMGKPGPRGVLCFVKHPPMARSATLPNQTNLKHNI